MAKQLNLIGNGQIVSAALHVEMERSYLEYAMSVIVGRALPDVRDGLKPVHRRILYAMHELGLTPDRPYRKCARVVGDVLGKYHPHGDQSVYDALVRMVQDFSCRYPLLAGHGNFGSVDNDPPAAMRYTETRLASLAHEAMLSEIGEATVDFTNNFDNSQQEPVVLPVQLPILLLNGCTGIAVGMATNIPPHNLSELVDGLIALIDKPDLPDTTLLELIPGPDFPTGGEIIDTSGIHDAYRTGKGIIPVRGVAQIEKLILEGRRRREKMAIVVTELPYQVNKAAWIEKVAELVNQGRIEDISDIRDESDREGIRVVIELKRDVEPATVMEKLYQYTALQSSFGVIMLGLVNNKPCQLSLRELLQEFLEFRERTLRRQYNHELDRSQERLHLLEGLLTALDNLDAVIDILRNAADGTTAKIRFQEDLDISDAQADSILAMPMRRLTGLEKQKLIAEYRELQQRVIELQNLLGDRHELMKALKKELRALKRKFADVRRTRILARSRHTQGAARSNHLDVEAEVLKDVQNSSSQDIHGDRQVEKPTRKKSNGATTKSQLELPVLSLPTRTENSIVEITQQGYIYWQNPEKKSSDNLNVLDRDGDFIVQTQVIGKQENIVIVTDSAKAYPLSVKDIPIINQKPLSTMISLLPKGAQKDAHKSVAQFFLTENLETLDLILLSQKGRIKRLPVSELTSLTNRGLVLMKLKDDDRLSYVCFTQEDQEIAIATTAGRVLRFTVNDQQIPVMGRNAQGLQALRLRYGEELAGCVASDSEEDHLLLVSQLGYGKRLPLSSLKVSNFGDIGNLALQFADKTDNLANMILAKSSSRVTLITDRPQKIILPIDSIAVSGKDGTGDRLVKLKSPEKVIDVNVCLE